ncbi:hypothetical protein FisN_9Hh263 [Fistulifera solaris]|uniref:WW domain-containing protein n=1 Tax=Fistulifera solaris TaxID=1519565 RepID=A0A1Z5JB36_FISSO|nr:hypothetical protein FisN_9Hh263 [Fistulifera solaris]|eukprot:GAX11169.1 hypothetical protein FisN_9Hh263 [Fistulifera solaris]
MRSFSFALTVLLCSLVTAQNAVRRFSFTRETCLDKGIFGTGDIQLVRNKNTTSCDASMGIQASDNDTQAFHMHSNGKLDSLLVRNNLSIELWLELDTVTPEDRKTIMTIVGKKNLQGLSICDQQGIDFQVHQQRDSFLITYRTADQFVEPCQSIRVGLNKTQGMTHFLVTLNDNSQEIFINGTSATLARQRFSLKSWISTKLIFMGYPLSDSSVWKGILHQMTLFSGDSPNANDLILQGLPASIPQSQDAAFVIHEDAEDVPGSHENDWYRTEAPLEDTGRIVLPYTSKNIVVRELQTDHNVTAPVPLPRVCFYLVTLPTVGRLYQANGSPIKSPSSQFSLISVESPIGELIYVPPLDQHSEDADMTSFEFCVWSDATLFHSRQCEAISTATVRVLSVNDPPIALPVEEVRLYEGSQSRIQLSGFDKDIGDSIRNFEITQPPQYGRLHLSVNAFREDNLHHGTPLTLLNNIVGSSDDSGSIYIDYDLLSDEVSVPAVHGSEGAQDSFSFRVQDQGGLWSTEEVVPIRILSALSGNSTASIIQQGVRNEKNIVVCGADNSGMKRRISLFVDSVDTQGQLLGPKGRVEAGQLLDDMSDAFPYENGFAFTYNPSLEMCHGKTTANATFFFRVVAFVGNSSEIASTSDGFSHKIQVVCQLDQLSLTLPTETIKVQESSLHKMTNATCSGSQNLNEDCSLVAINGISIGSSGFRSRKATVIVDIPHGFVSLKEAGWKYTELVHGRRSMARGNVTFRAFPEDMTLIFSNLEYQNHQAGETKLQIAILFGDCPIDVLSTPEESFWTPTCQLLRKTIRIQVHADPNKYRAKQLVAGAFPWPVLICMFVYPILYFWWIQKKSDAGKQFERELDVVWIQHRDADGKFYYENTITDTVTWMAPIGEECKLWVDPEA